MIVVKELNIGILPEAAVSGAALTQSESGDVQLVFNAKKAEARHLDSYGAFVQFKNCLITKFGYPNDEALSGHPLFEAGLSCYGIFEVFNSPWIEDVRIQNRKSFPDFEFKGLRHFIFTFHDSTFECLAEDFVVELRK